MIQSSFCQLDSICRSMNLSGCVRAGGRVSYRSILEAITMSLRKMQAALLVLALLNGPGVQAGESLSKSLLEKSVSKKESDGYRNRGRGQKAPTAPMVEKFLLDGKLALGEAALIEHLKLQSKDDQARFGLGMLQFLQAIERLMQDFHRYGTRDLSTSGFGPFRRLPVPVNADPETLTYEKARNIAKTFSENLSKADTSLSSISDTKVKLPIRFGLIRLDLNNDGQAESAETLWKVYSSLATNSRVTDKSAEQFTISFDRGDVHWLRGYCHLLMACCQIYLAHDTSEMFKCTGHLLFKKVETPYKYLHSGKHIKRIGSDDLELLDIIAFIHLIRWNVVEPERMTEALHHLETTVAQSDITWNFYMAESDDDCEWIPNPRQKGVIPDVHVTDAMVSAWRELMSNVDGVLAGKLLIPFWRGDDGRGVNLRRVFTEPTTLDLVLWVQGSAAEPYLETGEKTKIEMWRNVRREFGSQFPGFALWFN